MSFEIYDGNSGIPMGKAKIGGGGGGGDVTSSKLVPLIYVKSENSANQQSPMLNINGLFNTKDGTLYFGLPETAPLSEADSWEITIGKWHSTNLRSKSTVIAGDIDNYNAPALIYERSALKLYLSSNGSSWDINSTGSLALNANTVYWFKIGFTGSEYYLDYKINPKGNYTRSISISSTQKVYCERPFIFMNNGSDLSTYYTVGTLDISECSITIDNKVWWSGKTDYKWEDLVDSNIFVDYIGSNKSNGCYFNTGSVYPRKDSKIETEVKFIGDNDTTIFGSRVSTSSSPQLRLFRDNNKLKGNFFSSSSQQFVTIDDENWHTIILDLPNTKLTVDGVDYSITVGSDDPNSNLYVMANRAPDIADGGFQYMRKFNIYKNGELIYNAKPFRRINKTFGLYSTVNNQTSLCGGNYISVGEDLK